MRTSTLLMAMTCLASISMYAIDTRLPYTTASRRGPPGHAKLRERRKRERKLRKQARRH